MNHEDRNQLVAAWIFNTIKSSQLKHPDDENFWAVEKLSEFIQKDPQLAWELIFQIHETNKSDVIAENLSAGPLEDLLEYHGQAFISTVEERASKDPSFKYLLGGVWEVSPPGVWARLLKAREGIKWTFPNARSIHNENGS